MKKYLMVAVLSFLFVVPAGFEAAAKQKEEPPYVAAFDYTPVSHASPASAGVTFAIAKVINVGYASANKQLWSAYPQFANFNNAVKDDLFEIFTSKGFSIRGPYESYDLIPYSDKKSIDMMLLPIVDFQVSSKDFTSKQIGMFSVMFLYTGNAEVTGSITLELKEILTGQLMWRKSIPLQKFSFPYSVRSPYGYDPGLIMNTLAKEMEKQYPSLMNTVESLIDPEEMRIIKKQTQELKGKKGY